jgi:long-subunit fatty acid transport protein
LGLYDNIVYELQYFDEAKLKSIVVSGYDMSFAYAYALSDHLKVGLAVKLSNLGPNDSENKKTKDEDDTTNFKLGGQYNLLNGYIDLEQTSLSFNWGVGLSYQPEVTASLSKLAKTHALYKREVTLLPESQVLGTHLQFAWFTKGLSMVLNLSGDHKETSYTKMGDLFFPGTNANKIKIQEEILGLELLVSQQKQADSYAIRAGMAKQHSESHFAFDQKTFALGFGWSNGTTSIDIAHLLQKPSTNSSYSSERSQSNMTISFTF